MILFTFEHLVEVGHKRSGATGPFTKFLCYFFVAQTWLKDFCRCCRILMVGSWKSIFISMTAQRTSWNVTVFCKIDSKDFPKNWLISTFYSIFESKIILSEVRHRRKMAFQSTRHEIWTYKRKQIKNIFFDLNHWF